MPLIITFTDRNSNVSGAELRLLAGAKKQYGDKAEVLLIDRSKLDANSQLAAHFNSYVAFNGYPTTVLARPAEGLRPSDLKANSPHVVDSRYGADVIMLAKVPALKTEGKGPRPAPAKEVDPFSLSERRPERQTAPEKPPTVEGEDRTKEAARPKELTHPRSFNVTSQDDYNKVLRAAGENKEPMVALFYSSSSPHSARAVRDYIEAKKNVSGATYMAYDVDQLDKMSPQERQKSPIAAYADYVRREVGYPTTMVVPIAPPAQPGGNYSPEQNSATFRGGANSQDIERALSTARQTMSRFKFPEPAPKVEPAKPPEPARPYLPNVRFYA